MESWNGDGSFNVDRVTRDSNYISNLCLSILGNMTPKNIECYFAKYFNGLKDDGFIQRFQLMVFPDLSNTIFKTTDIEPDHETMEQMRKIIRSINSLQFLESVNLSIHEDKHHFKFDKNAQELFEKWQCNLMNIERKKESNDLFKEHILKYRKLVPALALIFHIIAIITNKASGEDVSINTLEMAIRYSEYVKAHARKVYNMKKIKDRDIGGYAMSLLTNIGRSELSKGFFIRDIERKEWSGLTNKGIITSVISYLEKHEYIFPEKTERSIKYKLWLTTNN